MLLSKIIYFDAAHSLINYLGKCKNVHGHTWKVEIRIVMSKFLLNLSDTFNGILLDFTEIAKIKELFDHKCLNDVININPTAENLASIICLMVTNLMWYRFEDIIPDSPCDFYTVSVKLWESKTSLVKINEHDAKSWLGTNDYKTFMTGD
ncbi:hypothetical protein LCGC14_1335860 [marine sediment metagenome]|uniref:6-pyruvoyl tetrahydrobiopterin synthase n=1 Tax=marine sediment metagenome TaxID=412755 RepID=A0A0F9MW73_9ZZZZ